MPMTAPKALAVIREIDDLLQNGYVNAAVERLAAFADEVRRESPKVCGNCKHGKRTSLDDTRCYKATPYLPTYRYADACADFEACETIYNTAHPATRKGE